ncbi:putative suppressor protein srp40 protein [Erysiphe neolycopersici]|uniref:Putative suppressor protein srp40 protein n=1 Tax=Erysiphe neolycopersici TaxID=212602 RepID=A0A420HB79_9PEZI|nr:putative suppressor protein srp40 protein [Erysiphe neolycopersici]
MSSKIRKLTKASLDNKASLSIDVQASHLPDSNFIHPLESLYKKSELHESKPLFKFFPNASEQDDSDIEQTQVLTQRNRVQSPLTPYTKRDFESRIIRSPAPTPDTAYHNKHFIWPTDKYGSSDLEEDQNGENNDSELHTLECERGFEVTDVRANDAKEKIITNNDNDLENNDSQSDFQKWFWANQGQINRGWKKRRKLVMKEQRQKDKSKKASK